MQFASLPIVMCCCLQIVVAQQTRHPLSAPYLSSGTYSRSFSNALNSASHIASLASLTRFSAGALGERRFMLKETAMYTAVIAIPTSSGNFAVRTRYMGYSSYNESELSIGYGRKLTNAVDIGLAFNYYRIGLAGYGNAGAINFEAGATFHINDQLHAGIHVYNPLQSRLGKHTDEKLASIYKAGLGYELSTTLLSTLEVIKQSDAATAVHIGIQYKATKQVFARAGYVTAQNVLYAGAGYKYKQFRIDMTTAFHQRLGFSPGILLLYEHDKKKSE